jgi:hypothetical protein
MARFSAHPLSRLIKLLAIGVVIGLGGMIYQVQSERHQLRSERSKDLVAASISIQTLAEQLQHPCPLQEENEEECGNIYEDRVAEFGRLAYVFKDSARSLLDRYPDKSRIIEAINFIDEFYNPGILDSSRRAAPSCARWPRASIRIATATRPCAVSLPTRRTETGYLRVLRPLMAGPKLKSRHPGWTYAAKAPWKTGPTTSLRF